jgi:3-oxoacyl-[acyl-carrier-protein] synthase-3
MSDVYVSHFASALGSKVQTVEQAEKAGQLFSPAAALRDAGFESHHICPDDENSYHLAARAFADSGIDPQAIDAMIYSTCLPLNGNIGDVGNTENFADSRDVKHLMRFPASKLQAEFGMDNAFIIGLNQQACTGMLGALRIARNMLYSEDGLKQILCITADRFPQNAIYEQAYNLISDGAAACLVSREAQGFRLLDIHHISNGAMVNASDDETVGSYFNYTCRLIDEALERAAYTMQDIRWVVPQNTNRKAWNILSGLLNLQSSQAFFPVMGQTGHVISADNIINLEQLQQSEQLSSGDRVLTFMAGFGSNWQCAILEAI